MQRLGIAEEVAKVVLFMASDDSSFMTGHAIVVDGELTAQ
jgi:NAD(P)-dependent dehydrogenase (short-subunit alcohol dehydrogenase family)